MTTPRSLPLLAVGLAVAVLVIQVRVVVGGKTWDDVRYHTEVAPPRLAAASALQRGELPEWWDGTGLGVPLLAEPSHGAAYPPIWLAATPHALDLVLVVHVLWAALGVALWVRRRGASEASALVAGVLIATTGLIASAAVRGALPALAQLPWIGVAASALAAAQDRRARTRAAIALGVFVAAVALTGQLGLLIDAIALAVLAGARRDTWVYLAGAIAAGLAIGAVQWLPAAFAIAAGAGAHVSGLPLARLVELIVPGSFGASDPDRAVTAIAGASAWAPSLYLGAPLLALAAIRRPSRREAAALGVLAVLALVVGRGGWPAWLGAPELHLAALGVVLAMHAGVGVDALIAGERRAVAALAVGGAASAVALAGLAAWTAIPERAVIDGVLGILCMIGAAAIARRARYVPLALALVVAPGVGALPSTAPTIDRAVVEMTPLWVRATTATREPRRVYHPAAVRQKPLELDEAIAMLAGTSGARWGLAAARSEDPARPALHDRVWLAASHAGGQLLARFGIELAILPASMVGPGHFTELARRAPWALVRYPSSPAAAVIASWRWSRDVETELRLVFPPGGSQGVGLVLAGDGPPSEEDTEPSPCAIDRWVDGAIDLRCTAAQPAYGVVSSTAAAGWSVEVDDRAVAWVTADVLRRAVALPAGAHRVRWRYHAPGLLLGFAIAVAGACALAGLALASRRRTPGRAPRATT